MCLSPVYCSYIFFFLNGLFLITVFLMYAQGTLWSLHMAGRTSVRLTMCGLCVTIRSKYELVDSVILVAEFVSWKSWCTFRMSIRCCEGLLKKSVVGLADTVVYQLPVVSSRIRWAVRERNNTLSWFIFVSTHTASKPLFYL